MNKQLLSLTIGALLASAPIATTLASDVKVYGTIQAEYNIEDVDDQSSEQGVDDNGGATRVGVRVTESLGKGLTAIAVLEFKANAAESGAGLTDRQQFVGLKHKRWGFLGAGTFNSPYKTSKKIDPFANTHLQARSAGGMSGMKGLLGHNGFVDSSIYYRSAELNGFTFDALLRPDEKLSGISDDNLVVDENDDNDFVVALNYNQGPIGAWLVHGQDNKSVGEDETATKIGAQVVLGQHTISGQYEWLDDVNPTSGNATQVSATGIGIAGNSNITDGSGLEVDGEIWFLGYQFKHGNNTLVVQLGGTESDDHTGFKGNETDYWAAGMIHNFSKRTMVFAGYSESSTNVSTGGSTADREVFSVGLRKTF